MTYTLAKSLREVFDDTPEIMSWFNEDTYAAAEARAHINGMREMMKEAADRIEELERLVKQYHAGIARLRRWIETGEIPR